MANALSNAVKKWIELSYKLYPSIHFFIQMPKTHQTIIIKKKPPLQKGKNAANTTGPNSQNELHTAGLQGQTHSKPHT